MSLEQNIQSDATQQTSGSWFTQLPRVRVKAFSPLALAAALRRKITWADPRHHRRCRIWGYLGYHDDNLKTIMTFLKIPGVSGMTIMTFLKINR